MAILMTAMAFVAGLLLGAVAMLLCIVLCQSVRRGDEQTSDEDDTSTREAVR
jgi:hypothetical protein